MDKRILLILSVIAVIIVGYLLLAMDAQYVISNRRAEMRFNNTGPLGPMLVPPPVPITFLFILLFLLLTPLILLYSHLQMEKTLSASSELLSKLVDKKDKGKIKIHESSLGRELVARLLDPKEMLIIERLIDQPKGILQTDVVKMPGMTKLKAHRIVERLRQKGVITVQRTGKTNLIKLDVRTRNILSGFE